MCCTKRGAAESAKAKLVNQKRITLNGVEGREATDDAPGSLQMRIRIFIIRRRFYQIIFVGKSGELSTPVVDTFLDSLRIRFDERRKRPDFPHQIRPSHVNLKFAT